jgi:indolepyruvate ferredoxin oxidoreductase
VAMNTGAFRWGRRIAADPKAIEMLNIPAPGDATDARRLSQSFDETVSRRVAFLTAYQDAAYAARYRQRVEAARTAESSKAPGKCGLAEAVARNLFKLMAYKDEYEVARL